MRDDQDRFEEQRIRDIQNEQARQERDRKAEFDRLERDRIAEEERLEREALLDAETGSSRGDKPKSLAARFFGRKPNENIDTRSDTANWAKRERDQADVDLKRKAADEQIAAERLQADEDAALDDVIATDTVAKPQFALPDEPIKKPMRGKFALLAVVAAIAVAGWFAYQKNGSLLPSAEPPVASRSLPTVAESDPIPTTGTGAASGVALPPVADAAPAPDANPIPSTPTAVDNIALAPVVDPATIAGKSPNDIALAPITNAQSTEKAPHDVALPAIAGTAEAAAAAALGPTSSGATVSQAQYEVLIQRLSRNEALSQSNETRITEIEKQVKELRDMLASRKPVASTASASAAPVRRAQPRKPVAQARPQQTVATATTPKYNGQILSVDMWGGKPSVVVSTGDPSDKRVRILSPGESINGITLKDASVQNRTATFEVGNGRTVQMSVEH